VQQHFQSLRLWDDNVKIIPGWFKDTLHKLYNITKLSLLRLDGDLYQSTSEALHALYPKLQVGGFLIVDDYLDWPGCAAATNDYRLKFNVVDQIITVFHGPGEIKRGVFWRKTLEGGGSNFTQLYT